MIIKKKCDIDRKEVFGFYLKFIWFFVFGSSLNIVYIGSKLKVSL